MCAECSLTPCHPRCPNAAPPRTVCVYVCGECGDGINDGDEYIEWDGAYYHAECVAGMPVCDIAEKLLGTRVREAVSARGVRDE